MYNRRPNEAPEVAGTGSFVVFHHFLPLPHFLLHLHPMVVLAVLVANRDPRGDAPRRLQEYR